MTWLAASGSFGASLLWGCAGPRTPQFHREPTRPAADLPMGLAGKVDVAPDVPAAIEALAYDPQTSGGLLAAGAEGGHLRGGGGVPN